VVDKRQSPLTEQRPEAAVTDKAETEIAVIRHVSPGTNDVRRSERFHDAVLSIVGVVPMAGDKGGPGYGSGTFHFGVQVPIDRKRATVGNGTHIAFAVEDRPVVDRSYAAALEYGGSDDDAPELRPNYDADYYGQWSAIRTVTKSRQ
jgi:hypothetical protein